MKNSKLYRTVFVAFLAMLIAFAGHSQTSENKKDTVCPTMADAIRVLEKGAMAKLYEEKIVLLQSDTANLRQQLLLLNMMIGKQDLVIKNYEDKDVNNKEILRLERSRLDAMKAERSTLEKQLADKDKQIKKLARKLGWMKGGIIVLAGITVYLLITK